MDEKLYIRVILDEKAQRNYKPLKRFGGLFQ